MANDKENGKGNMAVYLRLLTYAKKYWFRLTVGILAGFVVGGSLFGSLMLIPDMLMIVDQDASKKQQIEESAKKIIDGIDNGTEMTREEKQKVVSEILHPSDSDPKLTQSLSKLKKYQEDFNLPIEVGKRSVVVTWPSRVDFPIVDDDGRMTWQFFSIYVVLFIIVWTLKNVATYVNHYFTQWVGARVIADMRDEIYTKLINQSLRYYGKQDIGQLISRCTNDTSAIQDSVSNSIADATRCPIEILACAAAILCSALQQGNIGIMLLIFLGMPFCILPVLSLAKKIKKIYKKSFANIADILSRMHETFTGILVVKANNTERKEILSFHQVNIKYFRTIVRAMRLQLIMQPLMEIVAVAAALVFLVFSYSRGVTVTEMVAILAPAILAYRPIKDITKVINHLQRSLAAAERYFEIIDTDASLKEKAGAVDLEAFKDAIEFKNVTFSYENGGRKILDDLSFRINRGQMVAVVGATGSGKTTIANLIARFYDADSGKVTIDGKCVQDYTIRSLRKLIGVVTQEPILFNTTIAENIAYGSRNVTREQIVEAAKQANAHNFITSGSHPEGYDEECGEKGFKLSGGEKQRVAIARAILKNPPILILDEATSALDTVTEKLVQDALNRVMTNRTVFAIAHRLSTIQNADLIIVLDKGRIVEAGTHDELLKLGGKYKKLHDTQFAMDRSKDASTVI